jgi:hypothetical protein
MNEDKMYEYLETVPREIRQSIKQLNNDKNWAVYLAIMYGGRKSFNELKTEFNANANEINRVLTSLREGGLILKRVEKNADIGIKGKYLYYSSTHGRNLLNCLLESTPTKNTTLSDLWAPQYSVGSSSAAKRKPVDFREVALGSKMTAKSYYGQLAKGRV